MMYKEYYDNPKLNSGVTETRTYMSDSGMNDVKDKNKNSCIR